MAAVRKQFLNVDFDPSIREAFDALLAQGRAEHEIREAIVGVTAAQEELLTRGVQPGKSRCTKCGSFNIETDCGDHNGRAFDATMCGDCGELLDVCI